MIRQPYTIAFVLDAHTHLTPIESLNLALAPLGITAVKYATSLLDAAPGDGDLWQRLSEADFIVVQTHGSLAYFRSFAYFREQIAKGKHVFVLNGMADEMKEVEQWLPLSPADRLQLTRYIKCRDQANILQLCRYVAARFGGLSVTYEDVSMPDWDGLYIPRSIGQAELDYKARLLEARRQGRPIAGIIIPYYLHVGDNLAHVDALIDRLIELGISPLPIYTTAARDLETGSRGVYHALADHAYHEGELLPEVWINLLGYSLGIFEGAELVWQEGQDTSPLVAMNVPVVQAYHTLLTQAQWRASIEGIDASTLVSAVYYPEFDGQIDSYPIGAKDETDPEGVRIVPLEDGVDIVARLVANWIKLRRTPAQDKRVAIILHNMPPRADMIGSAAGLDTPASVFNILQLLKRMGIYCPTNYATGEEIIQAIARGLSNDTTWLDDAQVLERAIDHIPTSLYQRWFATLPRETQSKLQRDWGSVPGDLKVIADCMPVPGLWHGNVFIGLQPPRGYEEQADKIYHSTEIAPPHFYEAIYKWVRYVFEADVVIHVGTHGTLEWLPGKEKALSKACFPQTNIDDLPHLYPYHTTVVGEGIQAKRRSSAVLLSHLEPTSVEGGTYDQLTELDTQVNRYMTAPMSVAQRELLADSITALSRELSLDRDIAHRHIEMDDTDVYITALHDWLGVLKRSMVKDGLHIYGRAPEHERMQHFVRTMHRLPLGSCLGIEHALALYYGYDYDSLRLFPHERWACGRTSIQVLEMITQRSKALFALLAESGYTPLGTELIAAALGEGKEAHLPEVCQILTFAASEVYPRLLETTQELDRLEVGLCGGFVLPSKGGSPTRGHLEILPTGRNMYAIDPNEIPSRTAYNIGVRLGEQLLERYLLSDPVVPESIAFVLYSGDQMRTYGEDIGEILWLMGLRPQWLSPTSDRVVGLEVISLEELGRPRIDVVSRISGLLRDTFPSIIALLDDAAKLVAALDEPHEQNYIRKHVAQDLDALRQQGVDPRLAEQEALVRVFGCPPGNYGGGIDVLVENKNWQTNSDLATTAITWAAHAYSRELHGEIQRANLERQLSKVSATVKNENTIDFDLYDVDDEFIYHGGLIAAVAKCSGRQPQSFYGNSSDPRFTVVRRLEEESARVLRSRLLNPLWIDGLKRHGYKGAQDVAYNMDNLFGWDAAAGIVEDWSYEALVAHLLGNEANRSWMAECNPWALREISEKFLEAAQRGLWSQPQAESLALVEEVYISMEGLLEDEADR